MKCNYHTHSIYCDGKEEIPSYIEKAIRLKYNHLGFSSHAPIPIEEFGIKEADIPKYVEEINSLKQKYSKDIQLFTGLECDFITDTSYPFSHFKNDYKLDFIIGGIHLVKVPQSEDFWFIDGSKREIYDDGLKKFFYLDIKRAVTTFWEQTFEMIETEKFDIIAHLDKIKMHNQGRFFTQNEKWYLSLVDYALALIKNANIIIEINPRGIYKNRTDSFYPSDYILKSASKLGIPCLFSSDAHKSSELAFCYDESIAKLKECNIHEMVYLSNEGWKYYPI